jgi:hypothetical protein
MIQEAAANVTIRLANSLQSVYRHSSFDHYKYEMRRFTHVVRGLLVEIRPQSRRCDGWRLITETIQPHSPTENVAQHCSTAVLAFDNVRTIHVHAPCLDHDRSQICREYQFSMHPSM